jgi:hypothetical protein
MSNITIFDEPSNVETVRRKSRHADKMGRGPSMRRIALSNGRTFKCLVGGEQIGKTVTDELDVIIVDWQPEPSRKFYAKAYDKDAKATLPDCWSNLGDRPDPKSPSAQHSNCLDCPKNIKGSGGGERKACRYERRIAVLVVGDTEGHVYQMAIPSTSLFGDNVRNEYSFENYMKFLRGSNEGLDTVVTRVIYDTDSDVAKVRFKATRYLTAVEAGFVDAAQDNPATQRYIQLTVGAVDGAALPAPIARPAIAAPEEVVKSPFGDDEEPKGAPTKRASKKEAAPAPKPELKEVMSEWLDDEEDEAF